MEARSRRGVCYRSVRRLLVADRPTGCGGGGGRDTDRKTAPGATEMGFCVLGPVSRDAADRLRATTQRSPALNQ